MVWQPVWEKENSEFELKELSSRQSNDFENSHLTFPPLPPLICQIVSQVFKMYKDEFDCCG